MGSVCGPADVSLLASFLSLTAEERRTVFWVAGGVVVVKAALGLRGFASTARLLGGLRRPSFQSVDQTRSMARLAQRAMTRLPVRLSCLERSLVVWWLSGGEPAAQIRFGVQPAVDSDTPRFHAWVELDGVVLDDDVEDISSYLPLAAPEGIQTGRFD